MPSPLYRLDVIVSRNSTISTDGAISWSKKWVNNRQNADDNKDKNGKYLKDYYADLFDSRDNSSWKIFSDVAAENYTINNSWTTDDNKSIKGVITVSNPETIREIVEPIIPTYEIKNILLKENPYVYNGKYKFLIAETDNELAEVRIENNKIHIYDASAFAEKKQYLDIEKNPTNLKLIIFK